MLSSIDQLDQRNRWMDLNEAMKEQGLTENHEGESSSLGEHLLDGPAMPYHHFNKTDRDDLEEDLMIDVGSEQHKENQLVADLTHKVHSLSADYHALELQLNHSQLQVESLTQAESRLSTERDTLQFALAEVEQDKLLLETKLACVAGFEGGNNSGDCSSMTHVRGELLNMANQSIKDLQLGLEELKRAKSEGEAGKRGVQAATKLAAQNKALRQELREISDSLAKRTVLYAAQERRFNESTRVNHSLHTEKSGEIEHLRARLQQLERQFEQVDRDRVEAILRSREQDTAAQALQAQFSEVVERAQELDAELTTLTTQNASLQTTVQHLRGANFEELERGLVAEVEVIKADSQAREAELRRQLQAARDLVGQEAQHREALVDEIVSLRSELDDKVDLLHKVHSAQKQQQQQQHYHMNTMTNVDSSSSKGTHNHAMGAAAATLVDATRGLAPIKPEDQDDDVMGMGGSFDGKEGTAAADFSAMFDAAPPAHAVAAATDAASSPRSPVPVDPFYDSSSGANILYGSALTHSTLRVLQVLVSELFDSSTSSTSVNETVLLEIIRDGSQWHEDYGNGDDEYGEKENDENKAPGSSSSSARQTFIALQSRVKAMIEGAYETVQEDLLDDANAAAATMEGEGEEQFLPWGQLSRSVTGILGAVAGHLERVKRSERERHSNRDSSSVSVSSSGQHMSGGMLSKSFLVADDGDSVQQDDHASDNADANTVATSVVDSLQDELTALKDELVVRRQREQRLRHSLKEQGGKLATVLKRAAQLQLPSPTQQQHQQQQVQTLVAGAGTGAGTGGDGGNQNQNGHDKGEKAALSKLRRALEETQQALAMERADRAVLEQRAQGLQEEVAALHDEISSCRALLRLTDGSGETGLSHLQYIETLRGELATLKQQLTEQEHAAGAVADASPGDDDVTVVDVLAPRFEELNRRQHLEAQLVALQDRLDERSDLLVQTQAALDGAAGGPAAQAAVQAAVDLQQKVMTKQMDALVLSVRQDYESRLEQARAQLQASQDNDGRSSGVSKGKSSSNRTDTNPNVKANTASQTEFSPGDSVVDQRVQFAVAQQALSDEQKYAQVVEVQRLSLVREHQLELADKVGALQSSFETELASTKRSLRDKYHARVRDMRDGHEKEKAQWVAHIARMQQQLRGESASVNGVTTSSSSSSILQQQEVFPEMLSPEETAALVKSISSGRAVPLPPYSQTVMRASTDSSNSSGSDSKHGLQRQQEEDSRDMSFRSDDLQFSSARSSIDRSRDSSSSGGVDDDNYAAGSDVNASKLSVASSATASPARWERTSTPSDRLRGVNVSAMETPPVHASASSSSSAVAKPAARVSASAGKATSVSPSKGRSTKAPSSSSSSSRRLNGYGNKDSTPPSASSVRRSIDRSSPGSGSGYGQQQLKQPASSRTPDVLGGSMPSSSSSRKKRSGEQTASATKSSGSKGKGSSSSSAVPRRFPLAGM